jgi:cytochrome b
MTNADNTIEAGGARPPATVKVWDLFVRVFHWSLASLFVIAYATGDEVERVHVAAGYAIAGLIVLRVAWGVLGPHYARFNTFVRTPHEVCAYLRNAALLKSPRYLGHNPAGGVMILALLAMLAGTCITAYMMTTDAFWGAKWLEHIHEVLANLTVVLIVLHVLGVLFASFEHRENLVKADNGTKANLPRNLSRLNYGGAAL